MKFVSNRDVWVNTSLGHFLDFKKGVPQEAPRILHALLMEKGIIPVEDEGQAIDPANNELGERKTKVILAPEEQLERDDAILEVVKAMVKRNSSKDFTGAGHPKAQAVASVLKWGTDQKEVSTVWEKHRQELLKAKDEGTL